MALLGVYINAGSACLGTGLICIAHGIAGPQLGAAAVPDTALYQVRGQLAISIPIALVTLTATSVNWFNGNGVGINGQHLVALWHGLIRVVPFALGVSAAALAVQAAQFIA